MVERRRAFSMSYTNGKHAGDKGMTRVVFKIFEFERYSPYYKNNQRPLLSLFFPKVFFF